MANAERGEVDLPVGEKTYTLHLSRNAIVEAETVLGKSFPEIFQEFRDSPSYALLRALLWASMRRYHRAVSLLEVGDLMDELADDELVVVRLADVIGKALASKKAAASDPT